MNPESFADAALVLVGHGSTRNADSSAPVRQHAAALRRRGVFAEVAEGFWKGAPDIGGVLGRVAAARVFVVPLFISEGYFTEEAIPAALGLRANGQPRFARVQAVRGRTVHYGRPVGTHPTMTAVVLARARGVIERFPFPRAPRLDETTLFLAGHGTTRNEQSRQAVERQAEIVRDQKVFADVRGVFLLERPEIGEVYELATTRNLVVVPFFISDGQHVAEDVPVLLGEPARVVRERLERGRPTWRNPSERHGKRVWYSASVGTEPVLAEVILERVQEAAAWPVGGH